MKIEITVSPTGESKVETRGFVGSSCRDASRFVEEALGTQLSEQRTAEFYGSVEQPTTIAQGQ